MTTANEEEPKILDVPIGLNATGMRKEFDSLGDVEVPADRYWGAQTQRSLIHFSIGDDRMPKRVYHAYGYVKKAAALVNAAEGRLAPWKAEAIVRADHPVQRALRGELVRRGHVRRAGHLRDLRRDLVPEPRRCVQPGADRGAAHGQHQQPGGGVLHLGDRVVQRARVAGPCLLYTSPSPRD